MAKPARPKPVTPPPTIKDRVRARLKAKGAGDIFTEGWYPHQLAKPTDDTLCAPERKYMGEFRAFYPSGKDPKKRLENGILYPWLSIPGGARDHGGIDIYAPYFPYPYETPVYALADGEIWNRTEWNDRRSNGKREGLGNRTHLKVTEPRKGGVTELVQISYGHLSRFAGDDWKTNDERIWRSVKAGELIGYAGVSGNANDDKEGTWRTPKFKFNAGHVHLQALSGIAKADLYEVLPRKLALHPDLGHLSPPLKNEKTQSVRNPNSFDSGVLRTEPPVPAIPVAHLASVQSLRLGPPNAAGIRRYRSPFQWLDGARAAKLDVTRAAYEAMGRRLDEEEYRTAALDRWAEKISSDGDPENFHLDTAAALMERANERLSELKVRASETESFTPQGAQALLSVLHLMEAQYVLMGGPAIEALNQGSTKDAIPRPRCALGVRGSFFALSYPGAVAAMQYAKLPVQIDGKAVGSSTFSVTFGAGGLRHATISSLAFNSHFLATGGDRDAIKKQILNIGKAARQICLLHRWLQSHHYRISRGQTDWIDKFEKEFKEVVKRQKIARSGLRELSTERKTTLLRSLAESNLALFRQAKVEAEGTSARAPALHGLAVAPFEKGGSPCDHPHHS